MRFLIGMLLIATSLFALNGFDVNMDEKKYYDADRSDQDVLSEQAQILEYFIKSEVSDEIISQYKSGKVKISAKEVIKYVKDKKMKSKNKNFNIEEVNNEE